MIIDSHQHVMLPTQMQIDKMKEAGIEKTILFTTTPHVEKAKNLEEIQTEMNVLYKILGGVVTKEERIAAMEQSVLELKNVIQQHEDHFLGFGPILLSLNEKEISESVRKNIEENHFCGIGEITPGTEEQVEQLEKVFRALQNYKKYPIWIHTFHPVSQVGLQKIMGLCETYPSVPVILGHSGGYHWMEALTFAKGHPNVYLDLSAAFTSIMVKTAIHEIPTQCVFSSDAPFGDPFLCRQMIEYLSPSSSIAKLVLGENIEELLGL